MIRYGALFVLSLIWSAYQILRPGGWANFQDMGFLMFLPAIMLGSLGIIGFARHGRAQINAEEAAAAAAAAEPAQ